MAPTAALAMDPASGAAVDTARLRLAFMHDSVVTYSAVHSSALTSSAKTTPSESAPASRDATASRSGRQSATLTARTVATGNTAGGDIDTGTGNTPDTEACVPAKDAVTTCSEPTHSRVTSLIRHLRWGCSTPTHSKRKPLAITPLLFTTRYGHTAVYDVDEHASNVDLNGTADTSAGDSRTGSGGGASGHRSAVGPHAVSYAPPALGPMGLCAVASSNGTIVVVQTTPLQQSTEEMPPEVSVENPPLPTPPSPHPLRVPLASSCTTQASYCVTAMALAVSPTGRDVDDSATTREAVSSVTMVASVVKSELDASSGFTTTTSLMTCCIQIDPRNGLLTGNVSPWHVIGLKSHHTCGESAAKHVCC